MLNIPLQIKCSQVLKKIPAGGGFVRVHGYSKKAPAILCGAALLRSCGYSKKHPRYCVVQSRCVVVGTQKDTHNVEHSTAN